MKPKLISKLPLFTLIIICSLSCDFIEHMRTYQRFNTKIDVTNDSILYESHSINAFHPDTLNETTNLYFLCKIWGFAKYYHENTDKNLLDVDSILLHSIPMVLKCRSREELNSIYLGIINSIQVNSFQNKNPYPRIEDYSIIRDNWFYNDEFINDSLSKRLEELFLGHSGTKNNYVYNRNNIGTVRLLNEKEYNSSSSEDIRLLGLFRYWNTINYFYPNKHKINGNWDSILYKSIPKFREAETKQDYHKAIYQLTNLLKDTHASYPATIDENVFGPYRANFRMLNIYDTLVVHEIRDTRSYTDFKTGDIIIAIDGVDVKYLYDSLQAYVGGGNYWSNQSFVCNAVLSMYDSVSAFTVIRSNDTLEIQSHNQKAEELYQKRLDEIESNTKKPLYKWVSDTVVYINLESATSRNLKKNLKTVKHAKFIIVDLRCYPDAKITRRISDFFVPISPFFAYVSYADTRFPGMIRYHKSSKAIGSKNYYNGKIILLVNEFTESYSEYLAMLIQANPNTITIGPSSSGADGNVSQLTFPGNVTTIYTGIGMYYPNLTTTQGIGVKIDYIVEPTVGSIQNKIDLIYQKAIELCK